MSATRSNHRAGRGDVYRPSYSPHPGNRRRSADPPDILSSFRNTSSHSAHGNSGPESQSRPLMRNILNRYRPGPPNEHHRLLSVKQTRDLLRKKPSPLELYRWERTAHCRLFAGRSIPTFVAKAQMTFKEANHVRQSIWTQEYLRSTALLTSSFGSANDISAEQRGQMAIPGDGPGEEAEVGVGLVEKATTDRSSGDGDKMEVERGEEQWDQDMDMLDIVEDHP